VTTCFGLYYQAIIRSQANNTSRIELQCLASSNSVTYLWPDDGLVI